MSSAQSRVPGQRGSPNRKRAGSWDTSIRNLNIMEQHNRRQRSLHHKRAGSWDTSICNLNIREENNRRQLADCTAFSSSSNSSADVADFLGTYMGVIKKGGNNKASTSDESTPSDINPSTEKKAQDTTSSPSGKDEMAAKGAESGKSKEDHSNQEENDCSKATEKENGDTGTSDSDFKKKKNKKRRKICTLCFCYMLSVCLACASGVWFGMTLHIHDNESSEEKMVALVPWVKDEDNAEGSSPSQSPSSGQFSNVEGVDVALTFGSKMVTSSSSPSSSKIPSMTPTSSPTISAIPTVIPSDSPSTPFPSYSPSSSPSISYAPSSSPTPLPGCPDQLVRSIKLGNDGMLTMYYEVVVHNADLSDLGGLLCVFLEYKGAAGWLGFALSEASRDPAFGRKEAIIGLPGVMSSVAVATESAHLGQQNAPVGGGPPFANPGKYEIPAGGFNGFSGPNLSAMKSFDSQTLSNMSVLTTRTNDDTLVTHMSFAKYLREPGEIEIDPFKSNLFLYAVAAFDEDGEYDGNPDWNVKYHQLLQNFEVSKDSGLETVRGRVSTSPSRKRLRQPKQLGQ